MVDMRDMLLKWGAVGENIANFHNEEEPVKHRKQNI